MPLKEEVLKDSTTKKLTKLWLFLFTFALVINVIPYLPLGESGAEELQVVMQTNHSAICSSIAFREASPRCNSGLLSEGPAGALPGDLRVQGARCSLPILAIHRTSLPTSLSYTKGCFVVPAKVFLAANSSRGPPRA